MNESIRAAMVAIHSGDGAVQGAAFESLAKATDESVDWAYEVWDELVDGLTSKDHRLRSIASQLLCNLAKSDPEERILDVLEDLIKVTRDEKFVTARHCLLSLWKIGAAGDPQKRRVVDALAGRFEDCAGEKNCTLIRFDIIQGLRKLYGLVEDESIRETADHLIATEADLKYRKKYSGVWKK